MKWKTQVVLMVVGLAALVLPFFFMSGWLKYLVMFVGSIALHAVWSLYAGTPVAKEERDAPLSFSEEDYKVRDNDCSHWADIGIGMGVGRDD